MTCKLCEDYKEQFNTGPFTSIEFKAQSFTRDFVTKELITCRWYECKFCGQEFNRAWKEQPETKVYPSKPQKQTCWEKFKFKWGL